MIAVCLLDTWVSALRACPLINWRLKFLKILVPCGSWKENRPSRDYGDLGMVAQSFGLAEMGVGFFALFLFSGRKRKPRK